MLFFIGFYLFTIKPLEANLSSPPMLPKALAGPCLVLSKYVADTKGSHPRRKSVSV